MATNTNPEFDSFVGKWVAFRDYRGELQTGLVIAIENHYERMAVVETLNNEKFGLSLVEDSFTVVTRN